MKFLDTNILLYSLSTAAGEAEKAARAREILDGEDCALSVQVLQEFYVQATRPTRSDAISHELAAAFMQSWLRFKVQETTLAVMQAALEIRAAHGFSYWDSAIIAAARALGCRELLTEDMADGREVEGVMIRNPFR